MIVGVGGPQSLDELQAMAERTFGRINRQSWDGDGRLDNGEQLTLFPYAYLMRQIQVQTVGDTPYLILLFPMPNLNEYYRSKPESYVALLVTNKYRGSLL